MTYYFHSTIFLPKYLLYNIKRPFFVLRIHSTLSKIILFRQRATIIFYHLQIISFLLQAHLKSRQKHSTLSVLLFHSSAFNKAYCFPIITQDQYTSASPNLDSSYSLVSFAFRLALRLCNTNSSSCKQWCFIVIVGYLSSYIWRRDRNKSEHPGAVRLSSHQPEIGEKHFKLI